MVLFTSTHTTWKSKKHQSKVGQMSSVKERAGLSLVRRYIRIDKKTGCWLWKLSKTKDGYGRKNIPGHTTKIAHKWVWEILVGLVPDGFTLDHVKEKCTRRDCVNPAHIEAVPHKENMRRSSNTKLTQADVENIKVLVTANWKQKEVAEAYGISQSHVSRTITEKNWL
jgi:predicted DNA-binding protein (UPF0251 family)